jgi:hypothetical protein
MSPNRYRRRLTEALKKGVSALVQSQLVPPETHLLYVYKPTCGDLGKMIDLMAVWFFTAYSTAVGILSYDVIREHRLSVSEQIQKKID